MARVDVLDITSHSVKRHGLYLVQVFSYQHHRLSQRSLCDGCGKSGVGHVVDGIDGGSTGVGQPVGRCIVIIVIHDVIATCETEERRSTQ